MTPTVKATLIGGTAVLMWATLALFTTLTGRVPPFLLVALAFAVASAMIAVKWVVCRQNPLSYLRQPWPVWLLGVGGLFGYHFFYFLALRNAPPVEAGLIAYLWPLLIVLFSSLLPGERLRWWHLAGALAGLAGAALLVTGGGKVAFRADHMLGYLAAVACAFTWSGYSVLSRFVKSVPTDTVGGFCAASAVLGFACHLIFEETVLPASVLEWLAVLALGLGPVGLAFFTWDHGVKHGDIKALGAASYAAPLLSTILLVLFGMGAATWVLAAACVLIVGGAVLASKDMFARPAVPPDIAEKP
ncbi:DMT family transporter [Oceanibaculum sp.]|uniref:aromatic amino acid exporter YddG n=1 Tax=Oceanibaculum sp. TaxID=1903597 RepID=UPI00258DC974|nr:EamA family transporter [Oceanibaculum sp.]MCH2393202.1 EamA family transporter [Oceanibaculum sp.]